MRITFISQARFPTEKAHGHQIAQVCAAMTRLKHAVTVVAPEVTNAVHEHPRDYYGLSESFEVVRLPVFDGHRAWWVPGILAFSFTMRSYGRALRTWIAAHPADLLYTRSPLLASVLLETGIPVALELHTLPRRTSAFIAACNRCRTVVCLTQPMRDELVTWGAHPERITVEGDGVDLRRFASLPSSADAKSRWHLPPGRAVIVYVGSLVTRGTIEKGVKELLQAVALMKAVRPPPSLPFGGPSVGLSPRRGREVAESFIFCWIIGGPREKVEEYRRFAEHLGLMAEDVRFEGPVHNIRVPSALAAADVCVYPAPASDHPFFLRDTSPLKIFEYLASGKPTVCADLPPIRSVIDSSLVHFCRPGDSKDIARAIEEALHAPKVSEEARRALLNHVSWDARMERILSRSLS